MKTTTKEKPILFSTPMVRAILDGQKTMTRRVMNPQPVQPASPEKWSAFARFNPVGENGPFWCWAFDEGHGPVRQIETDAHPYHYPKYRVGDVLWVRETWQDAEDDAACSYRYKADGYGPEYKWKPSIFMPRDAARIFLRVTDVQAERVQDITEEAAKAEGVPTDANILCLSGGSYREGFRILWDMIHAKNTERMWKSNPWVWVYTFETATTGQPGLDGKDCGEWKRTGRLST